MSDKVGVTLKVEGVMKALMEACAKVDRRTLSAYVESLVAEDAKAKKIRVEELVAKEKPSRADRSSSVLEAILAMELPDEIELEWWRDFVMMRETSKKPTITPLTLNAANLVLKKCRQAIANGWPMEPQFEEATAREWAMPVYDQHLNTRANGKEIVAKPKLSTSEVSARKVKLMNHEGLVGHNRDRFVDFGLIVELIDTAFATDQPLEMRMLGAMLDKFYKSGNKEKCNQWVRDLIESQAILDDDGEFIAMRGFQ